MVVHVPLKNRETGIMETITLSDELMDAAHMVYSWMKEQGDPESVMLNGLRLVRDDER